MTIAERHRKQHFRSKLEHQDDGYHEAYSASYEGRVYDCSCGFSSPDENERDKHILDNGGEPCEKS